MKRGEIYIADFTGEECVGCEQTKSFRPVIIISPNKANRNKRCDIVTVALISSQVESLNVTHTLITGDKCRLKKQSKIMLEHIRTISKQRLISYMGQVDHETIKDMDSKIQLATGIFDFI